MRSMYRSSVNLPGQQHSNSALSWTYTASTSIAKSAIGAAAFNLCIVLFLAAGVRSVVGIERRETRRRFLPIPMLQIGAQWFVRANTASNSRGSVGAAVLLRAGNHGSCRWEYREVSNFGLVVALGTSVRLCAFDRAVYPYPAGTRDGPLTS